MSYKYELQKYKTGSKVDCPSCGHKKRFTLYIDTTTGQALHRTVGKCDRESNCGYHYTPKQYFADNGQPMQARSVPITPTPPKQADFVPFVLVEKSESSQSNFVSFLSTLFDNGAIVQNLCKTYKLGATKQREVIFWQVDTQSNVRSGKIMQYDPESGKRSKTQPTDWVHARMIKAKQIKDFNLIQCFFGQHLLNSNPSATVAIVESEKTAIICSGLMPDFIWLAAGSLHGLNIDKCSCLAGRNVVLFPDLSKQQANRMTAFEVWSARAIDMSRAHGCKVLVSDLLERNASEAEREQGLDIADYLISQQAATPEPTQAPEPTAEPTAEAIPEPEPEPMNSDIALQLVGLNANVSKQAIISQLIQSYQFSETRAKKGFNELADSGKISKLHIGEFYMLNTVGNTPF